MLRRDFLHAGAAGLVGMTAWPSCGPAENDEILADTGAPLPGRIPVSLMSASHEEVDLDLRVLSGRMPREIAGHVFVVGALPFGDGTPLFNGPGMMYRIDLDGDRPRLVSRIAKSPCWYADQATADDDALGFVNLGMARISRALDLHNELNTAWVPMGDRMLVTYDGGRPWELDPTTLELITPVGRLDEWPSGALSALVPGPFGAYLSTAHPYWDEHTNELLSVAHGTPIGDRPGFLSFMRWDGSGPVQFWRAIADDGTGIEILQSVHQVAVTKDYVIAVDTAFLAESEQMLDPDYSAAQFPDTIAWVIRRSDLVDGVDTVVARRVVYARESVHLTADYENPGGEITLYVAHNTATDASEWVRATDRLVADDAPVRAELAGIIPSATDINVIGRHVIDGESGEVIRSEVVADPDYTWGIAFFSFRGNTAPARHSSLFFNSVGFTEETLTHRVLDLYRDHPYRQVPVSELNGGRAPTIFRFDVDAMAVADGYTFPAGRAASSPQFVPREGGGPSDGWVVCTIASDDTSTVGSSGNEIWVFDARDLGQGPLARLGHPRLDFGFTLHTGFLPELRPRSATYRVAVRDDYAAKLVDAPDDVQALFEQHVFPPFDT